MFGFSSNLLIELQYLYPLSSILHFPIIALPTAISPASLSSNISYSEPLFPLPHHHKNSFTSDPAVPSHFLCNLSYFSSLLPGVSPSLSHNLFLFSGLPNTFLQSYVGADWSAQLLSLACQT